MRKKNTPFRTPALGAGAAAFLLLLAAAGQPVAAGTQAVPVPEPTPASLRATLLYGPAAASAPPEEAVRKRSVPLAFGLSAVLPGAGQGYNRHGIKAAVAVALEAVLVTGYVTFRGRGLDEEAAYIRYAHTYWDPLRYAAWLEDFSAWLPDVAPGTIYRPEGIDFSRPDGWTAEEQAAVRRLFDEIRALEERLYFPQTRASFPHKLPYFAEQQYYELIGKYYQFAPGWTDYPVWEVDGTYTDAIDPTRTGAGGDRPHVQGRILDYARQHARANDLLRRASRLSAFILVNHLLAAVDAAVFAKLYNDRLEARVTLGETFEGVPQPTAALRVRW